MLRAPTINNATRRGVLASAVVHGGIALLLLHANATGQRDAEPVEIDLLETPPTPPTSPHELDLGLSGAPKASTRIGASTSHVAIALLTTPKNDAPPAPSSDGSSAVSPEIAPETATSVRLCDAEDCVLEALNRCLAGDGEGCVDVGQYYERARADPFSAIKWYVKGCGLASRTACLANDRIQGAMPVGWSHHAFLSPT